MLIGDITLSSVLTDITSIMTSLFAGVGNVIDIIMSNPILLIAVCIPFVGVVVGLARRFLNL